KAFTPDSSVRINIVGHPEVLEQVGAIKLADYTDQLARHYKIDLVGSHAYLNRAALVGCKNQLLSENYAKQLYTRRYLRDTSVTGRLGDIQVNEDGSKTMNDKDQKIIHRWDYEFGKPTWTTQSSKNISKVLDHLKLGLDNETALNIPDSLTYEEIGKPIDEGTTKTAYTLKNHPDLLFLQLNENLEESNYIEQLKNEVEWSNKFREMGVKTPTYFKVLSVIDEDAQEHQGVLVERIHDSLITTPRWMTPPGERITHKTLSDIQNLLQQFEQHSNLSIGDFQMLLGRDGQLYVVDPFNTYSSSSETLSPSSQKIREDNIKDLKEWRKTSLNTLRVFDQNQGMHAILVDKAMLERDPAFEKSLLNKAKKQQDLVVMSYDSEGTTKVLYEPKTNYEIDRIEVMVDKSNHFISKAQVRSLIRGNLKVSSDMVFRHALKEDFSNYRSNIIVQNGNSEVAIKAAQALANKHPDSSIIVRFDANGQLITLTDGLYTPKGNVRLSFVDHGTDLNEEGAQSLADKVKILQQTYGNDSTDIERIALVGCSTDGVNQNLTQDFAKAIYNDIPELTTAEITGRKGDMQINPDGTKTMETGGKKMIYQWNDDLNIVTQQTEESKRSGEILENLKLGCVSSKGSSDTDIIDADIIDIDSIPDTLTTEQVDLGDAVGAGSFKTAYNFKGRPDLLVLLLESESQSNDIANEVTCLEQLDALGMKTPERYKQITFVDRSIPNFNIQQRGLVVQKIKGARDIRLRNRTYINPQSSLLDNCNNETLKDIKNLQKIFANNPHLFVQDFQGIIAEDGQLYVIDPQNVDLHESSKNNSIQLGALQGFEQTILKRHKRFTDKALNHIAYIDSRIWESYSDARKQQILSDPRKEDNKVIIVYNFATGEKEVIHEPSNSKDLDFNTVEVITQDNQNQDVDLRKESIDFMNQQGWVKSRDLIFRVNTSEDHEALNLKSNGKNKYNIILSIGEDKITKDAAEALLGKHPDTSIIATLDEQGKLVFPKGKAFTPDSSVRINIVGHSEALEKVGATKLANYTDQLVRHYKINSTDNSAYLNRAALVGCNNEKLSQDYANQLYTRKYLRDTSVTGRLGDIHINKDGSKTMNGDDQKIVHRWNHEVEKPTWVTQSSANIGDVLDHLKLGLDDGTTPDSLTYKDIGKSIGHGSTKTAYTLKDHPDLLFLQLDKWRDDERSVGQLKNEIEWINKFREMGIKTPKYFKTISMIDEDNQEHHGILVERIYDSIITKPGRLPVPDERVTHKTLSDIQNLLQKFDQHPNLDIDDLQMLLGRDGQLYVMDPLNTNPPSSEFSSDFSQEEREYHIEHLQRWRDTSLKILKEFDQNQGMHAIFVSKKMLEDDPKFEQSLLDKAQKQQDLVVMSYDSKGTTKVLYEPKTSYKIDRIEVIVDENNRFINEYKMEDFVRRNPKVSSDMVFRHALKKDFSKYRSNIIVQNGNSEAAVKAAQAL
ncbi:hypothetical protein BSPWISOX_1455, partial [uncultured Gammaproteobacteria bacterium]